MRMATPSAGTIRQRYKNLYWAWKSMKQRCQNPRCAAYCNYGARGIKVCDEWQEFEPFLEWALENGWEHGLDIDRVDNNGDYKPGNCRWSTRRENINNRRMTMMLTVNGETKPRSEWEEIVGLTRGVTKSWVTAHGREYAERRIEMALNGDYRPKDFGYSHKKPVIHVESGKVYDSVREAARAFGLASCTLSNAMREHRKTSAGTFVLKESGYETADII